MCLKGNYERKPEYGSSGMKLKGKIFCSTFVVLGLFQETEARDDVCKS